MATGNSTRPASGVYDIPYAPGYAVYKSDIYSQWNLGNHTIDRRKWKKLKPWLTDGSRPTVSIKTTTGMRKILVSVLVCEAHHGPKPPDKECCCHKDDDCTNNNPNNLYWGTRRENAADARRNGRCNFARGESIARSKLTERKVLKMRELYKSGHTIAEIARRFDITWNGARDVIKGRTWQHVGSGAKEANGEKGSFGPAPEKLVNDKATVKALLGLCK